MVNILLMKMIHLIFYQSIGLCRIFPDYFYTFSLWQSDTKAKLIDFIMIDTVILCGGSSISDWDSESSLEGPKDSHLADTYWDWIEQQLKQSK